MGSYLVKRILLFIPTLVMVSLIVFFLMRVIPGDPALVLLMGDSGEGRFTEEDLAAVRHKLGTDRPLLVQYSTWALGMLKGDMGVSMYYQEPVIQELRRRVPITLQLATMAILISFIISVPLGVLTAVRQDTWVDHAGKDS
jgi:peptide/nickel transport system permease protein